MNVCTDVVTDAKYTGVLQQNGQDSVLHAKKICKLQNIMYGSDTKN